MSVVNIAAYRFVSLDDLPALQAAVRERAQACGLKGTVLLAEEGINLFLAGSRAGIDDWLAWLRHGEAFGGRLADIEVKESRSGHVPFRKLLVKIKREIIRMNHPAIRPEADRAAAVDARTVARWLRQGSDDDGRELVMLDTRNAFEVDAGTFHGALDWRIGKFTEFPAAVQAHRGELEGKTVVSFCTGGIRCEKAAIYLAEAGIERIYQLEGGILKYFEEVGGEGYDGACFVFDGRETLDPALQPGVDGPAPIG
ncbi:rhodanese superfamily protein [Pigmentiphaga humi]|uniref:tRNA uridine(34) hydroxylase n=1 Tax=Pigmentiphaga humi TaxID=2478468 RepID=A0A3P4B2L9_9BURK|nr:sulfurtransferase [Pigmentiphaga humi]VCU69405.1 rhodanese superfamily protein [Pigmentiphaga humi]